jgi:hypothetical protein
MKQFILHIHPQANRKLKRFARSVRREIGYWNMREIARRLDVNVRYVSDNLERGIEPPDTTETGRVTRVKMFMKAYKPKPKPKQPRPPDLRPEWLKRRLKAIRGMVKETNDAVVRRRD